MSPEEGRLPLVVIAGRPNVGKSTLVNRFVGRRASIVGPQAGLTRDDVRRRVEWNGRLFEVADTGGVIADRKPGLGLRVSDRALDTVEDADLVVLVVDLTTGITRDDLELARSLHRVKVPVVLVANKADGPVAESGLAELWSLGFGEPLPVSALHGRGAGDLLDRLVEILPDDAGPTEPQMPSISIVGRPNVGKSSIFNALIGRERSIVHDEPGTTRDAVDTIVELDGRSYRFIDTAGLRRRAKTTGVDIYGTGRTREAIGRSDLSVLVLDASEGATTQDQRIAEMVAGYGVGAIVALNKWDLIEDEEQALRVERYVSERLGFVDHAPMVRTSARTRRGLDKLIAEIEPVLQGRTIRIPTPRLNSIVAGAQQKTPVPRSGHRNVKVLYATQVEEAPPTFVLFTSGPIAKSWQRFLEHRLREEFGFNGNPIIMKVRPKKRERV